MEESEMTCKHYPDKPSPPNGWKVFCGKCVIEEYYVDMLEKEKNKK